MSREQLELDYARLTEHRKGFFHGRDCHECIHRDFQTPEWHTGYAVGRKRRHDSLGRT